MVKDPYQILGIKRGASKEQIKAAYRKLVSQYHPDKYRDNPLQDLAQEKLKEINEAYHQLMGGGTNDYQREETSARPSRDPLQQVRHFVNQQRIQEAEILLHQITKRNAEWFFLNGIIFSHKGFFQQAFVNIEKASKMDPQNREYQSVYQELKRAAQAPRHTSYAPQQQGDCDCCTICSFLYCLNCFCDCVGGC